MTVRTKKITTSVNKQKHDALIDNGGSVAELLNAAIDGYFNGLDGYYIQPVVDLSATLTELYATKEIIDQRLEALQVRQSVINDKIKNVEEELELTTQHAKESKQSTRITQLLREINQAIVYNDYKIPDIELVVKKQLKEIKKLQPDFSLENQIATMKKYSS